MSAGAPDNPPEAAVGTVPSAIQECPGNAQDALLLPVAFQCVPSTFAAFSREPVRPVDFH